MRRIFFTVVALACLVACVLVAYIFYLARFDPGYHRLFGFRVDVDSAGDVAFPISPGRDLPYVPAVILAPAMVVCGVIFLAWLSRTVERARQHAREGRPSYLAFTRGYWLFLSPFRKLLLIASVGVVAIWIWSESGSVLGWTTPGRRNTIMVYSGEAVWKHRSIPAADYSSAVGPAHGLIVFGMGAFVMPTTQGGRIWTYALALWFCTLVLAALPVKTFFTFRREDLRRRRVEAGHCVACGYDLRGIEGRCAECGTSIVRPSAGPLTTRE